MSEGIGLNGVESQLELFLSAQHFPPFCNLLINFIYSPRWNGRRVVDTYAVLAWN